MKRFLLAAMFVLVASSARAELYDGTQPLGAGDPGVIRLPYNWSGPFAIDRGNGLANIELDYLDYSLGHYIAIGGSAQIFSGPHAGTYGLATGGPLTFLSPSGCFIVDNVYGPGDLYGTGTNWTGFNEFGLLFVNSTGEEINVLAGRSDGFWCTTLFSSDYSTHDSVTATPEPSTMAIAGVALSCILAVCVRRRRHA